MAFRAFVAVAVPAMPQVGAVLGELATIRADVKPVEATNLHFTLSFLGNVEDDARAPIADALREASRGIAPFDLDLRKVGAFPSARRPRVVWAGVADPKPISDLAVRVRAALAQRGMPADDKDFRAHLTLARVRSDRGVDEIVAFLRRHGQDDLGRARVAEVVLFRSVLGPRGPTYEPLESAALEA